MREHVRVLKEQWVRYCGTKRLGNHDEIQTLKRQIGELEIGIHARIKQMEYIGAQILVDEKLKLEEKLQEFQPMEFKAYAMREFAKDYKTVTKKHSLTDRDRLFFKIYFYREYLGTAVIQIQLMLGISANMYYRVYREGMERFFPADGTEELSEVG